MDGWMEMEMENVSRGDTWVKSVVTFIKPILTTSQSTGQFLKRLQLWWTCLEKSTSVFSP